MIVVADTSPLNYLILTGYPDLLFRLYRHVLVPPAVVEELSAPEAPHTVLTWMKNRPAWLEVRAITGTDASLNHLGKGEREGIALAEALHADLVLMDDLEARREAVNRKLPVRGTLGVLTEAARQNLLSLKDAFIRLQATSFYAAPALLTWLLEEEERRRKNR